MSLEESMNALAESNLKLAAAMSHYAGVMDKYGAKVIGANNGDEPAAATQAAAAEPKKPGRPKKDEPKPAGDDGFGEAEAKSAAPAKITADQMKAKLLEVRDAHGDKQPALDIIGKYGYQGIPDVKPADYQKIWADCEESIESAKA